MGIVKKTGMQWPGSGSLPSTQETAITLLFRNSNHRNNPKHRFTSIYRLNADRDTVNALLIFLALDSFAMASRSALLVGGAGGGCWTPLTDPRGLRLSGARLPLFASAEAVLLSPPNRFIFAAFRERDIALTIAVWGVRRGCRCYSVQQRLWRKCESNVEQQREGARLSQNRKTFPLSQNRKIAQNVCSMSKACVSLRTHLNYRFCKTGFNLKLLFGSY